MADFEFSCQSRPVSSPITEVCVLEGGSGSCKLRYHFLVLFSRVANITENIFEGVSMDEKWPI